MSIYKAYTDLERELVLALAELVNDHTCILGQPCPSWAGKIATGDVSGGTGMERAKRVLGKIKKGVNK